MEKQLEKHRNSKCLNYEVNTQAKDLIDIICQYSGCLRTATIETVHGYMCEEHAKKECDKI